MREISFLLILIVIGCTEKQEEAKKASPVTVLNTGVIINYYEDDSLNQTRSYVLPVMYFDFVAVNSGDSLLNLVVNISEEERPIKLYVSFSHEGEKDTLILTDFESFRINKIRPNDTTRFTISGYIPRILPEETDKDFSVKELMKSIAENGNIYYLPNPRDQELLEEGYLLADTLHIEKSKDFEIVYRDPDDTTIE